MQGQRASGRIKQFKGIPNTAKDFLHGQAAGLGTSSMRICNSTNGTQGLMRLLIALMLQAKPLQCKNQTNWKRTGRIGEIEKGSKYLAGPFHFINDFVAKTAGDAADECNPQFSTLLLCKRRLDLQLAQLPVRARG